jgi:adenylate cyclase
MAIDIDAIYASTWTNYQIARKSLAVNKEMRMSFQASAISDVIPGYSADKLEFGSYETNLRGKNLVFVDWRGV